LDASNLEENSSELHAGALEISSTGDPFFSLPEYGSAYRAFVDDTVHFLAAAMDEMLGGMPRPKMRRGYKGRNSFAAGETVETILIPFRSSFRFSKQTVTNCDVSEFAAGLYSIAEDYVAAIMPQVFGGFSALSEATGNIVDAGGKPLTFDLVLDAIETMDLLFDDDDNPILPNLVVNPQTRVPEMSDDEKARLEGILERKRDAYIAGKRHRTLPRDRW
jgi:hypothetical protein